MSRGLQILLLEPFYGGSHRQWAVELQRWSSHAVEILSLPDRHWKWRMHGSAVTFAKVILERESQPDLILANDLVDVAALRGILAASGISLPVATYFHENQITYPVSPLDTDIREKRDLHYGFINYTTALASDRLFFNSDFHRRIFVESLAEFLSNFPDAVELSTVGLIAGKSRTLSLGMELSRLDDYIQREPADTGSAPVILWNHRWEHDKDPVGFLQWMVRLKDRGVAFKLALLGERSARQSEKLVQLKSVLADHILVDKAVEGFESYARWLQRADILPVTSRQDFFGRSVVEAAYCGVRPLVPARLAFPEHFKDIAFHYQDTEDGFRQLEGWIQSGAWRNPVALSSELRRYDWSVLIGEYDSAFSEVVASRDTFRP